MPASLTGFERRGGRRAVLGAICALVAGPTAAGAVECGEVLTEDTVLEADLTCPGDGLVVGADGIRVDLAGHVLRGRPFPSPVPGTAGIRNEGHHDVEIRNGTIACFENGVELVGVTGNRLEALIIYEIDHGSAILLVESSQNHVGSNQLDCNSALINLADSHRNRIEGNRSLFQSGYGLILVRSTYNEVIDNFLASDSDAILLYQADHNLVEGNTGDSGSDFSIHLAESNENRVVGNITGSGEGIAVEGHRNLIAGNHLHGEQFPLLIGGDSNRIEANIITSGYFEFAAVALRGDHNQVTGNTVVGSLTGSCIRDRHPIAGIHITGGVGNRLIGNVVTEQCFDGILVEGTAHATRLRRNLAADNGDDGLDIEDSTAQIIGNTALGNGDYGIEAAPGVRGGGNRAAGNGNPEQCLEIACK